MAGTDEPARAVSEKIGEILTTPLGAIPEHHEFGFDVLDEDGDPKAGLGADAVQNSVLKALAAFEPRIAVEDVSLNYDGDELVGIRIDYSIKATGASHSNTVRYG